MRRRCVFGVSRARNSARLIEVDPKPDQADVLGPVYLLRVDIAKAETLAVKAIVAAACQYEVAAIATGRVPTLSSLMWKRPVRERALIWVIVAALLTDHFFWRRIS